MATKPYTVALKEENRVMESAFAHAEHLDQINRHDALQAVIAETLPQFDREDQIERFRLFERVKANALRVLVVCC